MIEAGKYYKTRDGRKVGPMVENEGNSYWPWIDTKTGDKGFAWMSDGKGCECTPQAEYNPDLDLIAEWTDTTDDTPKLWRDMTPAEKGALLLAHHEGKVIERSHNQGTTWKEKANGLWDENHAYRVKPADPVVETVTLYAGVHYGEWEASPVKMTPDKYLMTFNLIDGKPDCDSIRMEEL